MRYIFLLSLLFALPALGADRVIINPDSNGDLKLKVNVGGTVKDAVTVNGTSQQATINSGYTASATSNPLLTVQRDGGAVAGVFGYNDATTTMYVGTSTNHDFSLRTNNAARLTISSGGGLTYAPFGKGTLESSSTGVITSTNVWTASGGIYGVTCNVNGTCAGFVGYGGGIASFTRTSAGVYTGDLTASFWSAAPVCTVTDNGAGTTVCAVGNITSSSVPIICRNSTTGTATDGRPGLICQGSRL